MKSSPYSPKAIITSLRGLANQDASALATAVQKCDADRHTITFRREFAARVARVFVQLQGLIKEIPRTEDKIPTSTDTKKATLKAAGNNVSTGKVWNTCDEVSSLCRAGIVSHLVTSVKRYRAAMADVSEELEEWLEDDGEDEDDGASFGSADLDNASNDVDKAQAMVDKLMMSAPKIPHDDPDGIRKRVEIFLRRLKLTRSFYKMTMDRRLLVLPALPAADTGAVMSRVDKLMLLLKQVPDDCDILVQTLYDMDTAENDNCTMKLLAKVNAAAELAKRPWMEEKDEITTRITNFQTLLNNAEGKS